MALGNENLSDALGRLGLEGSSLLPGDREELFDSGGRMAIDPSEDVLEILEGVDAVQLASPSEGVEDCCGLSALAAADEEKILAAYGQGSDRLLDSVVIGPEAEIVDVFPKDGFLVPGVGEGFSEKGLWQSHSRIDELEESVHDADSALAPEHEDSGVGEPALSFGQQPLHAMLDPVEDGDEGDEGLGLFDADVEGVNHASPQMSPTPYPEYAFPSEDGVEARRCVGLDMAPEVLQNPSGSLLRLVVREVEEGHRRPTSGPIGPHPSGDGFAGAPFEHGLGSLVDVDVVRLEDRPPVFEVKRVQRLGASHHPVGQRAPGDLDALAVEDLCLAVERKPVSVFGDGDVGEQTDVRLAAGDGAVGDGGHGDSGVAAFAPVGAYILWADVADGVETAGLEGEGFGDVLAHPDHRLPGGWADLHVIGEVEDLVDALEVRRDLHPAVEVGHVGGLLPLVRDPLRLGWNRLALAIEDVAFLEERVESLLIGIGKDMPANEVKYAGRKKAGEVSNGFR